AGVERGAQLDVGGDVGDVLDAGLAVRAFGVGWRAVGDGAERHAGGGVDDLVGDAARHEARADHGDPDGPALFLTLGEGGVYEDHAPTLLSSAAAVPRASAAALAASKAGHDSSFGDSSVTGAGHWMAKAGSS